MSKVVIIGGGAAGFFAALRCSKLFEESKQKAQIIVLEATSHYLKKVKISGGGRCNVTHNQFEIKKFIENYPRGSKELRSPFHTFQAQDTVNWFKERGIKIVAESDGRMFPHTNSSQTIIDCFLNEAEKGKVELRKNHNVQGVTKNSQGEFVLTIRNEPEMVCDALIIATGSSPVGYRLAKSLGHNITELAPSLFSFKIESPLLEGLSGTSFTRVSVQLTLPEQKRKFTEIGPALITHWGLSGPAVLKMSAWAARELKNSQYQGKIRVNWLGDLNQNQVFEKLKEIREKNQKSLVKNFAIEGLTKAFWQRLLEVNEIDLTATWSSLSHKHLNKIALRLVNSEFSIAGKNRYKDEFVECGGVNLKEIDFKSMESKHCPGLYFAGEILDVDGITGGFNFQNAWTTGWLAGGHIVSSFRQKQCVMKA